jgi:glycosyltransferase involved in cell wall biosynthesis
LEKFSGPEKFSKNFIFSKRKSIRIGNRSIFIYRKLEAIGVDLIITEYAIRNLLTYRLLFAKRKHLLAFWGHGRTYTKHNTKAEEWLKAKLAMRADWFFGYTEKGVDSLVSRGYPRNRTTTVRNSTDTIELASLIKNIMSDQVSDFRLKNNLENVPTAIFVGELESSKRIDFLISSAIQINTHLGSFQLVIFGDGPDLHKVLSACSQYSFIKFRGRADLQTLAMISKIGDCIMMPGRVGLVAVDSLALGIPIVTTNWPWHAPEVEYLRSEDNCLILADDLNIYSSGVAALLANSAMLKEMRANCQRESKYYSIEDMSENFHSGVMKIFSTNDPC